MKFSLGYDPIGGDHYEISTEKSTDLKSYFVFLIVPCTPKLIDANI
jgi:hypothetical protein